MNIAGMNITFRHFPFNYFLDCMDNLGINGIELWGGEPHLYVYRNILGNIRSLRREIKSRNMKIICYTPEQCIYPYNNASILITLHPRMLIGEKKALNILWKTFMPRWS